MGECTESSMDYADMVTKLCEENRSTGIEQQSRNYDKVDGVAINSPKIPVLLSPEELKTTCLSLKNPKKFKRNAELRREPVRDFQSEEDPEKALYECLDYWVNKLFLKDWIINVGIYPQEEVIDSEGNLRSGTCTFDPASRSAVIRIRESAEEDSRLIIKACHERVLVHELLHLTYNLTEPVDTIESIFYHEHEHELLEKMAKTLIMTKYDLDFDWFKNF